MTAVGQQPPYPPFLVTAGTDRRAVAVDVTADASTTMVEMTVHGHWSPELGRQVDATLRSCLAGPVAAVILDLHDLSDLHGVSRPFWTAAARTARLGSRPARLALCVPAPTMLDHRLRHGDGPPALVFATMQQARQALAATLPRAFRMQARLSPRPLSVRAARDLADEACHRWQLPHLRQDAALVVSELVTNAVRHAGTDLVVTVVRTGPGLLLAVRDGDTRYPQLHGSPHPHLHDKHRPHLHDKSRPRPYEKSRPRPYAKSGAADTVVLDERGRGLLLVHAVAPAWGALPTRGGKVVWATLSPGIPGSAPAD